MMPIFGEANSRIDCTDLDVSLELQHTIIEPDFFKGQKIVHQSVIDPEGTRTYSRNERYVEATVQEFLFKYADKGISVLRTLRTMEDKIVTFFFHLDSGLIQEMWLANVDVYPLLAPNRNDIAVLTLVNARYLQISRRIKARDGKFIKTEDGKFIRSRGIIL